MEGSHRPINKKLLGKRFPHKPFFLMQPCVIDAFVVFIVVVAHTKLFSGGVGRGAGGDGGGA